MGSLCSKGAEDTSPKKLAPSKLAPYGSSAQPNTANTSKKHARDDGKRPELPNKQKEAIGKDGAEHRPTLEEATAETDALYNKYRAAADEHAKLRAKYFDEASEAHKAGDGKRAKELSDKGKEEGRLMEEARLKAARAIFDAKNKRQPAGTIDLHGLQVKEAELILTEELTKAKKKGAKELRIIIGAGHHSDSKGPKIGPAIKKMLSDNRTAWHEDGTNTSGGSIIATL